MHLPISRRLALALGTLVAFVLALGGLTVSLASMGTDRSSATSSPTSVAAADTAPPAPARAATPAPSPSFRIDPPLPSLFGSIGDSISVAFDAEPRFGPQPGHEWTMGTEKGDGVFSLLERFRALGGSPLTVDAAVAGARMGDAAGQADSIVAEAGKIAAGGTAFVTMELGGNDACAATPVADFERELRAAIDVLAGRPAGGNHAGGLPDGSRLLVLSVPNIVRLRELTAGVPEAQRVYASFGLCKAYLAPSVTPASLEAGGARIAAYNAVLRRVCEEVETAYGKTGRLHCRSDQDASAAASMFATNFALADVSSLDFFHPSVSGQAMIADGAWKAGYWASVPLPSSSGVAARGATAGG